MLMLKTSFHTVAAKSLTVILVDTTQHLLMENQSPIPQLHQEHKVHLHYNHTDSCKFSRWTARQSFEFMYARPWQLVSDFYSSVVKGDSSLFHLFGTQSHFVHDDIIIPEVSNKNGTEVVSSEDKSGRWARVTFKILVSYHGGSFDGWQKQPGLNTVQGLVELSLGRFVDEKKAQLLKEKSKPLEGCAGVAGRTDKGVSAFQQVCSFYTWRKDVKPRDIEDTINNAAPGKLRVVSVSEVSRAFHPNFSAKWRRYLYIFPLNGGENRDQCDNKKDVEVYDALNTVSGKKSSEEVVEISETKDEDELEGGKIPRSFSVSRVNQHLQQLEGKLLSYKIFARDTKASRNVGPPTQCFLYHARAGEARLPCSDHEEGRKVLCVELVANRFLRKMVRVLVATAIREAAAGAEDDALLKLMEATCRRASAPPAPPDGLCFVDVGYTDFDKTCCLIK